MKDIKFANNTIVLYYVTQLAREAAQIHKSTKENNVQIFD